MSYVNLHCHSHYSLLDGLNKPGQIAEMAANYGYGAAALTDHGVVNGCVDFYQACKQQKIKPILGVEFYIAPINSTIKDNNNRKLSHLPMLAKNLAGWKTLLNIVSVSNTEEHFYYKPRLDINTLAEMLDGNVIGFSGHLGSDLANCMFHDRQSYDGKLRSDAKDVACRWAEKMQDAFGKGNFFIEIQLIDKDHSPNAELVSSILREVSDITGIPKIGTADSHYAERKDAVDQRVLLCGSLKTTFKDVHRGLEAGEDVGLGGFFTSDNFHIPSLEEMKALHTEDELKNTVLISEMCEEYELASKPRFPSFDCGGLSEFEYLKGLCEEGWKRKLERRNINKQEYRERLDFELSVVQKASLSGYFLVVQDYVNWCKNKGWLIGAGRGSAAGCLVSYLTNITSIDPIPHNLLFSRFYNEGRNTADHISLPDIDIDVPTERRDDIIIYLSDKYGHENVCQIGTFSRLQAKAVVREVMRAHDAAPNEILNRVSKSFPEESKVADKMQADSEKSLIIWTLKYEPEKVKDYCYLNEDGSLGGEYANYFEQAIRLEGTFKSQGTHAAGVIVAGEPISSFIPVVRSSKGNYVTGFEMNHSEFVGGIKLDVLGNLALDKLGYVNNLLGGI